MKIAQVVSVFSPYKSGISRVAEDFASLNGPGLEMTVITPGYGLAPGKENKGYEVLRLEPWLKLGNAALLPQLCLQSRRFDILHLHYPFFGANEMVWLSKLTIARRTRIIIHYHMDTEKLGLVKTFFSIPSKLVFSSLFGKAGLITCASLDYVKNSAISDYHRQFPEKFREVPFGVDTGFFRPAAGKEDSGPLELLFVGGLDKAHYFKGVDVLLKALAGLSGRDWILRVVGKGELEDDYKKMAEAINISDKVLFLGGLSDDDMASVYRNSDVFILPSINKHEAFGIVILEALASGLPVIASRLPGVKTVFTDTEEGFYAEPGNADELRAKLAFMLDNRSFLPKMSRKARQLAEEKYDKKRNILIMKGIYEEVYEDMPDQ